MSISIQIQSLFNHSTKLHRIILFIIIKAFLVDTVFNNSL